MTQKLKTFPFIFVFVVFALYLGYQLYNFTYALDGETELHKVHLQKSQDEIKDLNKKLTEGEKFEASLDLKKAEIRKQVEHLTEYQGALSEAPDVPSLIKILLTEAKKVDIKVDVITPGKFTQKDFYKEQEFKLDVRGNYYQILLFALRVAKLQRILRIESYVLKPAPVSISPRAVTLAASLSVRAYQYTSSKEDQIGKDLH